MWYADDSAAVGKLESAYQWWEILNQASPSLGYFVNPSKLTKDEHLTRAKSLFQDSEVNITTQGRPYLGAPLGSTKFVECFIFDKANHWIEVIDSLSGITKSQAHAALAVYMCISMVLSTK